ncbi:hypothetical protein GCM10022200_10840 [Microbacterium awajiense]|uniref:Uncharacterized protein n=1 Tax=Microbacterium awajiense TaxID=415214 RepID=A0ABP7ADG2_9MICO
MSSDLNNVLANLLATQQAARENQRAVSNAVNTSLAGGLAGAAGIANSLDALGRSALPPAVPDPLGNGAINQALIALTQAQLDSTNRNEHIANAVSGGVAAGAGGMAAVAAGLRQLQHPVAKSDSFMDRVRSAAGLPPSYGLVTSPGDYPSTAVQHVCPSCGGTGRVSY